MALTPTSEQQEIVDAFEWGQDLVIEAGAGTGKTSTLKLLAAASSGRGIYVAYNRSIAADAERSFPDSVTCATAHGLAYRALGHRFKHRLNGPRVPAMQAAKTLGIREPIRVSDTLVLAPQQLARMVGETVTRWCYSDEQQIRRRHVPPIPGLDQIAQRELARHLAPIAQRAWDEDLSQVDGQLRYQHDHYLKAWTLERPQLPADYVLLDEAQDSNGCVAGLVSSQDAQRVWVGDRQQAIYGWRGATDAMEHAPGQRLYLSQSFRFGPAVAGEANKWLGLLDAPLRLRGHQPIASRVEPVDEPTAILCRTNGGALDAVINALAAGRKPAMVGGGGELRRFAEGAEQLQQRGSTDHPDLFAFTSWSQVQAYVRESDGSDLAVLVRLVDTHTPRRVMALVDALVDEAIADVVVSTAHKAKGREWPTVRIATDFMPQQRGKEDEAPDVGREEMMLAYVAVTRAQLVLDRTGLAWVDRLLDGGWKPALPEETPGELVPGEDDITPEPQADEEPTVEAPRLRVGARVKYRDRPHSAVFTVHALAENPHSLATYADLEQPDGRLQRGIRIDDLEVA